MLCLDKKKWVETDLNNRQFKFEVQQRLIYRD